VEKRDPRDASLFSDSRSLQLVDGKESGILAGAFTSDLINTSDG
jgi:hypothetical protein